MLYMRKFQWLIFILSLFVAGTGVAQEAKQAFVNMPDSILPLLTKINREDCIDFLEYKMKAVVKNRFDKESEMTALTDDYVAMSLTPQSTFEMKLLPLSDTTRLICTVQTVCSRACDSRLSFYTADWSPLPSSAYIALPQIGDFMPDTLPSSIADTLGVAWQELRGEADLLLMRASLADTTGILTFTYTTPEYMNRESSARLLPLLKRREIRYEWEAGRFVRKEE